MRREFLVIIFSYWHLSRMALQTENPPTTPSAQVVGNAFVEQYYRILHHSPESVYRFYQDSSVLSRPDSNGVMTSVTTMQGINEKILSLDYKDYKAEIKTADAQKSYKDGVTVLVTGCLTGKDNLRRKFAQSFFLAPQDNGYFVLNDVFRYMEDDESLYSHAANGVGVKTVPLTPDQEPIHSSDPPATVQETSTLEVDQNVDEKSYDLSEQEIQLAFEKEDVMLSQSHSNGHDVSAAVESSSSSGQDDAPKKSYASIVKVTKGSLGPTQVYVPTNTIKVAPKKTENQSPGSVAPNSVPEASAPSSVGTPESSNTQDEVEGHSIYIRNLPFGVRVEQLDSEFKKFGPIKQGGIQVRNNKQQGYCFGFVEFQSLSSMNSAIQASPIIIGGRKVVVEIKRTTARVDISGRGRFSSGRGGYRSDSFKSRGSYSGGWAYGRNEYRIQGDFPGRGRSHAGRGEGYQRGRGGRPSGPKQNASS
ncbi:nuclear transport factor 2-like isoform X1 [Juglans microcarpa x Juglans regia]|uniref:nuclear transport factor 2-like isoform X1 n=2 Tax=Juglans microcarpa x Juglans regia TaxID=2249226 RepID=UPI001B7E6499|nr:nuclear transport factor 2-like isoform X1 [Juglans microcarpa x Juglans regia]